MRLTGITINVSGALLCCALALCSILECSIFERSVYAQDITNLGGDLTSELPNQNALQVTAPNVTSEERRLKQLSGFAVFHRITAQRDGLGPRFNNASCGGCHVNNGRGDLRLSRTNSVGSTVLVKVGLRGLNQNGSPRALPGVGEQIRDHSLSGFNTKQRASVRWREIAKQYPDGVRYSLREPVLKISVPGYEQKDLATSLRMSPAIVGPGLLEAIDQATLIALSDPNDLDGNGVSGRVQYVLDRQSSSSVVGRFGFKASHPSVRQQTAAAAFHDMGITSTLFSARMTPKELSDEQLELLTIYLELGGVPQARNQDDTRVIAGKQIFQEIRCHDCHTMTLTTGGSAAPELVNQVIHPFTDLLLHDMGPGLRDTRPEFSASGREWRTTPLWGIGFAKNISNVAPRYLHDGRARSIEEAILWHSGEGARSRRAFIALAREQRRMLLEFLKSL